MTRSLLLFSTVASCVFQGLCLPVQASQGSAIFPRADLNPLISVNFPDPAIIEVNGTFYTFSTTSGGVNVPMASSTDMKSTISITQPDGELQDAMHALPSWTPQDNPGIWAPDVIQLADGSFVLYFSAYSTKNPIQHCVGAATSQSVTGPYIPEDKPLACPLDDGGAIDPAGFVDTDGKVYVVYKVDGNSLGGGGPCGNQDGSHHTPIMLQEVSAKDGFTLIGNPTVLIDRSDADGPLVEAPSLVRSSDGVYVLFFSSNCYNTQLYDTSYATAKSLMGPYVKSSKALLTTGLEGHLSPGGADVLADGSRIVFHADMKPADATVRYMYTQEINVQGASVFLV